MTVHLIKLCVGVDSPDELRRWQARRIADAKRRGRPPRLEHRTRSMPRRRGEVLDGGSLYWVIKGLIRLRQPILALEEAVDREGKRRCVIRFAPVLIATEPWPHRPFQGWRYLEPPDAPPDVRELAAEAAAAEMPAAMQRELRELGLL